MKYVTYNKKNRGVSLLLTILILNAILSIALGVSTLMLGEAKISREEPKSLRAYYAAEAGVERKLFESRKSSPDYNDIGSAPSWCTGSGRVCLDADTCYAVDVVSYPNPTTIKSYGCYKGTRRSIEVSY